MSVSLNLADIYGTSELIHKSFLRCCKSIFETYQFGYTCLLSLLTRDHSVLQRSTREPSLAVLCTSFYVLPVPSPAPRTFPAVSSTFDIQPYLGSSFKSSSSSRSWIILASCFRTSGGILLTSRSPFVGEGRCHHSYQTSAATSAGC